ncbi:MAG: hypothetical protein IJ486_01490 [Firmicutes bacterium]|nr:hypothetical protein [Bacillota bacterium]
MSEEYMKQGNGYGHRPDCGPPCEPRDHCEPGCPPKDLCCDSGNGWESWLPILILVFLLCGGFSGFGSGGNNCSDHCGDNGGSWGWILILIVLFCFCGGSGNDGRGGLFGGLF